MCIRDRNKTSLIDSFTEFISDLSVTNMIMINTIFAGNSQAVSYTHLRAHETVLDIVCRLLLEKKNRAHETVLDRECRLLLETNTNTP